MVKKRSLPRGWIKVCAPEIFYYEVAYGTNRVKETQETPLVGVLLLLQHPSVFTMGHSGIVENIIVPEETLVKEGIPVFHTNRGGDITYHGPGQLVGYPILNLREDGLTVPQYVWNLEEIVIRTLAGFGIGGQRISGRREAWVGRQKVCALGLRVSGEVSMHGFALNVNTNLKYFTYIIPCGITGVSITSVSKLLGHEVEIGEIQENLLRHFSQVFRLTFEEYKNTGAAMGFRGVASAPFVRSSFQADKMFKGIGRPHGNVEG